MWKKVVPGRMVTRLPELPWASQLFIHFLTKRDEQIHKKQNVGSARRVTRLAVLAAPIFLHINTLAHPAGSTRSRREI